jgi:hypothetical protein
MKKLFLIGVFVLLVFSAYAQTGDRHFEYSGNYSICPPENWVIQEVPGYNISFSLAPQKMDLRQISIVSMKVMMGLYQNMSIYRFKCLKPILLM